MTPATATVLGGSPVVAENQIGNWEDGRDSVRWRFRIPQPGRFEVRITYACIPSAAGSRFEVRADRLVRNATSVSTGSSWRDYKTFSLGAFELEAGEHVLEVVPSAGRTWKPISLRGVELAPPAGGPSVGRPADRDQ